MEKGINSLSLFSLITVQRISAAAYHSVLLLLVWRWKCKGIKLQPCGTTSSAAPHTSLDEFRYWTWSSPHLHTKSSHSSVPCLPASLSQVTFCSFSTVFWHAWESGLGPQYSHTVFICVFSAYVLLCYRRAVPHGMNFGGRVSILAVFVLPVANMERSDYIEGIVLGVIK